MKKLIALSLVALMVMGLSVTAFASLYDPTDTIVSNVSLVSPATPAALAANDAGAVAGIANAGFLEYENMVNIADDPSDFSPYEMQSGAVAPGQTIFIPLLNNNDVGVGNTGTGNRSFVVDADAVKSASVRLTYTLGRDSVESVRIVYKKYNIANANSVAAAANAGIGDTSASTTRYAYFLAVTMRDSTSTASRDVAFDVNIRKSSGTNNGNPAAFELKASVGLICSFPRMADNANDYEITSAFQVYDGKNDDGEQTFSFSKDPNSYFEVDVTGQDKILLRANVNYNSTVAAKFPAANLDFFNGSGTFNKIGTLYLYANPDSYLYVLNSDGSLSKSNASYDDAQECFEIRTRTLGSYVISDTELNLSVASEAPIATPDPPSEAPSPAPTPSYPPATGGGEYIPKPNPGTGAAA